MLLAYRQVIAGDKCKRIAQVGIIAGLAAAVVMAVFKNTTSLVDTGYWNLFIYITSIAALVLFLVFTGICMKRKSDKLIILAVVMLFIIGALAIFYSLPDVLTYPYQILQTEKTAFSTVFILKVIGILLAGVLCIVACVSVNMSARNLKRPLLFKLLLITLIINAVRQCGDMFSIMLAKRIIENNHMLFAYAKFTSNYSDLFIYLMMAVVVLISIINFVLSRHVNEPYSNSAQHRKIRAKWRNIKRWSWTVIICIIIAVFNMTVTNSIVNAEVELSPVEDCLEKDGAMYVSFDQVADGHLHRFAYTTESGTQIRFIVIKKPDSSSYGIGLDACDICGETGYYEKDGQVVCNLCDVVMNINTIGFKGGCNPIVVEYEIKDGYIIVPIDGLVEYESEFQ